jgi:hypothetical protein
MPLVTLVQRDGTVRFPFGDRSEQRSPRRPAGACRAFVLGVYPSAIHVRWDLPAWVHQKLGKAVGALAVSDEPIVFWDGDNAIGLVDAWKERVGFRAGDGPRDWGHVRGVGNGTSGRPVRDKILTFIGTDADDTWFTDAINEFFVKRGGAKARQQGDVIDSIYNPFARTVNLPLANLPRRPTPTALIRRALSGHRDRLRAELSEAGAPVVITLGEEARQVLAGIADHGEGPPTTPLTRGADIDEAYGLPGSLVIGDVEAAWYALAHPGNRDGYWAELHTRWQRHLRPDLVAR